MEISLRDRSEPRFVSFVATHEVKNLRPFPFRFINDFRQQNFADTVATEGRVEAASVEA